MKLQYNTCRMFDFLKDYISGEMEHWVFELDYDAYVIECFPKMELENLRFAWRFAKENDSAVEYSRRRGLTNLEKSSLRPTTITLIRANAFPLPLPLPGGIVFECAFIIDAYERANKRVLR